MMFADASATSRSIAACSPCVDRAADKRQSARMVVGEVPRPDQIDAVVIAPARGAIGAPLGRRWKGGNPCGVTTRPGAPDKSTSHW